MGFLIYSYPEGMSCHRSHPCVIDLVLFSHDYTTFCTINSEDDGIERSSGTLLTRSYREYMS